MPAEPPRTEVLVNAQGPWSIPEALLVEGCLQTLLEEEVAGGEVSVTLLDDQSIRALNLEYFQRDRPTDVIAFSLHDDGEPLLADLYVGYEQAKRQARALGVDLGEELLRLTVHGLLHVLGYRHPEGQERYQSEMFLRQEELVRSVLKREAV